MPALPKSALPPTWAEARRCFPRETSRSRASISFGPTTGRRRPRSTRCRRRSCRSRAPMGRDEEIQAQRDGGRGLARRAGHGRVAARATARCSPGWRAHRRRARPPGRDDGGGRAGRIAAAARQYLRAFFRSRSGTFDRSITAIRSTLACDGCPADLSATISFISPQAEYTPPLIYSESSNAKLVFLVEARPPLNQAAKLNPGEPMEVHPQEAHTPLGVRPP